MAKRGRRAQWLKFAIAAALPASGCGGKTDIDVDAGAPLAIPGGSGGGISTRGGTTSNRTTEAVFFPIGGRNPDTRTTRSQGGGGHGGDGNGIGAALSTAGRACLDEYETQEPPLRMKADLGRYSHRYTPSCAPDPGAPDLVYVWWVSSPDTYVVRTLGSSTDTALAAYSGYCGNVEAACNDDDAGLSRQSRLVLNVSTRQFVTLVVDGQPGDVVLSIDRESALIDVELGDELPVRVRGTTVGGRDTVTSSCGSRVGSNDMTFLFTAPADGTYAFVVESKSFSPALSLRFGGPGGDEITCNLAPAGRNSSVSYAMRSGQHVAVIVDGLLGEIGEFELVITENQSDSGSCCESSMRRAGCIDQEMMQCVCKERRDCCYYFWDPSCVDALLASGCGSCPASVI